MKKKEKHTEPAIAPQKKIFSEDPSETEVRNSDDKLLLITEEDLDTIPDPEEPFEPSPYQPPPPGEGP